jgi:hypothetical protein
MEVMVCSCIWEFQSIPSPTLFWNYLENRKTYGENVYDMRWALHFSLHLSFEIFPSPINTQRDVCRSSVRFEWKLKHWKIFLKFSIIKFYHNLWSSSWVVSCIPTDGQSELHRLSPALRTCLKFEENQPGLKKKNRIMLKRHEFKISVTHPYRIQPKAVSYFE